MMGNSYITKIAFGLYHFMMGNPSITKTVFGLYHFEIVGFIVLPFNVHSPEPKFLLFWSAKNKCKSLKSIVLKKKKINKIK